MIDFEQVKSAKLIYSDDYDENEDDEMSFSSIKLMLYDKNDNLYHLEDFTLKTDEPEDMTFYRSLPTVDGIINFVNIAYQLGKLGIKIEEKW